MGWQHVQKNPVFFIYFACDCILFTCENSRGRDIQQFFGWSIRLFFWHRIEFYGHQTACKSLRERDLYQALCCFGFLGSLPPICPFEIKLRKRSIQNRREWLVFWTIFASSVAVIYRPRLALERKKNHRRRKKLYLFFLSWRFVIFLSAKESNAHKTQIPVDRFTSLSVPSSSSLLVSHLHSFHQHSRN